MPDAHVDAVVEVDRAPFVRSAPGVSPGSAAAGIFREPLPVDVSRAAGDLFVLLTPAQGPIHRHAGLEVRVGVGLAEAGYFAAVSVRAYRYRSTRRRHVQVQFH